MVSLYLNKQRLFGKVSFSLIFLVLLIVLSLHSKVFAAQSTSISVTVTDAAYNPLYGKATITGGDLIVPTLATNLGNGKYSLGVTPGDYSITVSVPGFTSQSFETGSINIGQSFTRSVQLSPSNVAGIDLQGFYNSSTHPKLTVSGTLYWNAYGSFPTTSQVQIGFFDGNDVIVGIPLATIASNLNNFIIPETQIPAGATRIGAELINDGTLLAKNTISLWNFEYIPSLSYDDLNGFANTFNAVVSWTGVADESDIADYRLYSYTNGFKTKTLIANIPKSQLSKNYQYSFSDLPVGTAFLGIGIVNSHGEKAGSEPDIFVFDNMLSEVVSTVNTSSDLPLATNLKVNNNPNDTDTKLFSGFLTWDVPAESNAILGYKLYFADNEGNKIKPIRLTYFNGEWASLNSSFNTPMSVPNNATKFALYTVGIDSTESTTAVYAPITPIVNTPPIVDDVVASGVTFLDIDSRARYIHGLFIWSGAGNETNVKSYVFDFLDSSGNILAPLTEAQKGDGYALIIPATSVPTGATQIGVFVKYLDNHLASSYASTQLVDNTSVNQVNMAVKSALFRNTTKIGIQNIVLLMNAMAQVKGVENVTKEDIGTLLSLIDPIN